MEFLAQDPKTIFVGYNVKYGSKGDGTLINIPEHQLYETPVAENLMMGIAIGLSLEGFKPLVYYERFDFILNALDSIVNHLDKIKKMSRGEFEPKVIIRAVVGGKKKPFFTGLTHTQDFGDAINQMVDFPVQRIKHNTNIKGMYQWIYEHEDRSVLVIEEKDKYDTIL